MDALNVVDPFLKGKLLLLLDVLSKTTESNGAIVAIFNFMQFYVICGFMPTLAHKPTMYGSSLLIFLCKASSQTSLGCFNLDCKNQQKHVSRLPFQINRMLSCMKLLFCHTIIL